MASSHQKKIAGATIDLRLLSCHAASPDDTLARREARKEREHFDLISLEVLSLAARLTWLLITAVKHGCRRNTSKWHERILANPLK